jgi:hypothetical protein
MRAILQKRALRFVLIANVVSMLGSGMNAAAVAWHILQATHSEMALGNARRPANPSRHAVVAFHRGLD